MKNARLSRFGFALVTALFLASCSSGVTKREAHVAYRYDGQTFKKVVVRLSDELAADPEKAYRFQELRLEQSIENRLKANRLYDEQASNVVEIVIKDFRIRSGLNAQLFGFMAGSDNIEGIVTLKTAEGTVFNEFAVSASYALGGRAGGQDYTRIGYLSSEFGKLTVQTIVDKQDKPAR